MKTKLSSIIKQRGTGSIIFLAGIGAAAALALAVWGYICGEPTNRPISPQGQNINAFEQALKDAQK